MPAKLSEKNEKQGHTVEERSPRILASWLWEGNIKFLSAFAVTARLCSHLCLLSPSTCSHRVFLFSFPFCGWRCPFLGTRGHMQLWHTALGTSEQEGFGVLAWVHSRNSLMWEDCPLFSPQPAGDQPSTCCSRRADDGILRQAEDFIPGGHPLRRRPVQMSHARRQDLLPCSPLTRDSQPALAQISLQTLWFKALVQLQKPHPSAQSQWPA